MTCKTHEFHHHFPKLAEESGFTFNIHRPRTHVDWNKIRGIDIDSIIREKKFSVIEHHLNDILYCVFESEFDVRILDEGVIKMFRLAQLAVEYQQFCRHYLDRSVYVLREEITSLAQELDASRKSLREKEEELKKLKRKTKYPYRTQLPYGNDNIATMILKTLANKSDILPTSSNADALQYNKCSYCDKVFLNQLYLKSHLSRRHTSMLEIPQKDTTDNVQNTSSEKDSSKVNDEITELKTKLKDMEELITKFKADVSVVTEEKVQTPENKNPVNNKQNENEVKQTKDAEVSTNCEYSLIDKIEEWKKEEHEKYNKEINLLRNQIVEIINTFKAKEDVKSTQNEHDLIEQLHTTIKQQGVEIHLLKQELTKARLRTDDDELDKKKELETHMTVWTKRAEAQTKQYEVLLQKLNDVAQEAVQARAQAESERNRAAQLQVMLEENLNKSQENLHKVKKNPSKNEKHANSHEKQNGDIMKKEAKRKINKSTPVTDNKTLENLHRKAQELLNMTSTTSSEISSDENFGNNPQKNNHIKTEENRNNLQITLNRHSNKSLKTSVKPKLNERPNPKENFNEVPEPPAQKLKKAKQKSLSNIKSKIGNGTAIAPGSPLKLVRCKITEEVNNRLVTIGVDPLKNRLPKGHFQKQRMQLQQQCEHKSKKTPEYQRTKHSILAFLDSNTSDRNKEIAKIEEYVSPNRIPRTFSIANVISNVKNKALSFVKSNDITTKSKRNELSAEVAKKALMLLNTPPDSAQASPVRNEKIKETKNPSVEKKSQTFKKQSLEVEKPIRTKKLMKPRLVESSDESSESDHKYYKPTLVQATKSVDNLITSPARRPASATADYNGTICKLTVEKNEILLRSQSATDIIEDKIEKRNGLDLHGKPNQENSSDESSPIGTPTTALKKAKSEGNLPKQTKGVLKNASSISSLNKKKVLFDLDAIQMKSVSASPSQSITEKSDTNEKFELGLVNLDGEEWDISSIENEPIKNDTKIRVNSRTSPKIAELKETIENQLARRNETPSTALIGGVNLMPTTMKTSSLAGSNTSLGSSILDESDGIPSINHKAFIKPKKVTDKEDSEIDISEYSLDGIVNKKGNDSF